MRDWLSQDYPDYEIILVNDHSEDGGSELLTEAIGSDRRVRFIDMPEGKTGKKEALVYGIGHAKGGWIGCTDADCRPAGKKWISTMMSYAYEADILIGYGPYAYRHGFLNTFVRYETMYIAITYMGLHRWRHHYMAVGRNLFFKKEVFEKHGGFDGHMDLLSGSDDLFIANLRKKATFQIVDHPDTFTYSEPKETWRELWKQKRRHLSTSHRYPLLTQVILAGLSLSQILFYVSFIHLLFISSFTPSYIFIFFVRSILLTVVIYYSAKKLRERGLAIWSPLLDFILLLYYISLSFTVFYKPKNW